MAAFDPPDSGMERVSLQNCRRLPSFTRALQLIGEICNFEEFDQVCVTINWVSWLVYKNLSHVQVLLLPFGVEYKSWHPHSGTLARFARLGEACDHLA